MRRKLKKGERQAVYEKTDGRCAYCGCKLKIREMAVDHIKAVSRGGPDELDNYYAACRSCNHRKGSSSISSFRGQLERVVGVLQRDSVTFKVACRYGLVIPNPHKVVFYHEDPHGYSRNGFNDQNIAELAAENIKLKNEIASLNHRVRYLAEHQNKTANC